MSNVPTLKKLYTEQVIAELVKSRGYKNKHQVPKLIKININTGIDADADKNQIADIQRDVAAIAGQKPVITKSRKAIANFKLRENNPIGISLTLRGDRMWEFLDRLISLAIPRIRDFRGLNPKSFDGHGNYTFGVTEQLIFPEIEYDKIDTPRGMDITIVTTTPRGMDITIVTTARTDDEGRAFLGAFGFPFKQENR